MIYVPDDVSGEVVGAVSIAEEDEAMIITSTGKTLKITAESVRILGKAARGVRIVNIGAPDFVIGMDRVVNEPNAELLEDKAEGQAEGLTEEAISAQVALPDAEAALGGDESPAESADEASSEEMQNESEE